MWENWSRTGCFRLAEHVANSCDRMAVKNRVRIRPVKIPDPELKKMVVDSSRNPMILLQLKPPHPA